MRSAVELAELYVRRCSEMQRAGMNFSAYYIKTVVKFVAMGSDVMNLI